MKFSVSHADSSTFRAEGLRAFFAYRDLGILEATDGQVVAHVIRAVPGAEFAGTRHHHDVSFQLVYVLTGGGPRNATTVLVTYAYDNGFVVRDQGYAATIGVFLLVVSLAFTGLRWRTSRTRDQVG